MTALQSYTFRTGGIVDAESVNGNLRRSAADINRNLSKRYQYCPPIIVPLDGVTDTMTAAQRTIRFARPTANNPIEVIKVELYIYAASGVTWTLAASGSGVSWTSITAATAGATVESYAVSTTPIAVPTGNGVDFVVSGSAAGTLTRAWLVIHCRADRGVQGSTPTAVTPYVPTFVDATTSSAGSVLDTQLQALAAAVTRDAAAVTDLRCQCFVARSFSATQSWNIPSGAGMTGLAFNAYMVATAADEFKCESYAPGGTAVALTGTGTSNIVSGSGTVGTSNNDPTDTTDDSTLEFYDLVGTVELGYAFFWWS